MPQLRGADRRSMAMIKTSGVRQVLTRRGFLRRLGAVVAGILALPVIRSHHRSNLLSLREADFYRTEQGGSVD